MGGARSVKIGRQGVAISRPGGVFVTLIEEAADPAAAEWRPCIVIFPRFALKAGRWGASTGFLLPGRYLVRWSRTMRRNIYRSIS